MTGSVEDSAHLNDNINVEFATPEKQEARAFLRERFLRVITGIVAAFQEVRAVEYKIAQMWRQYQKKRSLMRECKQAEFYLYENTQVSAQFRGCDVDCLEVFVRNLETPLGTIPEAVLRASDIIYLNIHDINKE